MQLPGHVCCSVFWSPVHNVSTLYCVHQIKGLDSGRRYPPYTAHDHQITPHRVVTFTDIKS